MAIKTNIPLSIVFSKKQIIKFIKLFIPMMLTLLIYEFYVVNKVYNSRVSYIEHNLHKYMTLNTYSRETITNSALIIKAIYVEYNNEFYEYQGGNYVIIPKQPEYTFVLGTRITINGYTELIVNYEDKIVYYIIDDKKHLWYLYITLFNSIGIIFFVFIFIFFFNAYNTVKNNLIEKRSYEIELEGKLQRTLTESAHHEMLMPLAVIKTLFFDFITKLYPCQDDNTKVCNYILSMETSQCKACISDNFSREIDLIAREYFTRIDLSIIQLESVLMQMAETKHVKYSNGDISLYKLITNAAATLNASSVNKVALEMREQDKDLLAKYAVNKPLNNGNILNIFTNHITNSIEAKSNVIKIKANYDYDNKAMVMYIGDNGVGIRNKYNHIIDIDDLFKNGYSTKDSHGRSIVVKNTIFNIIKDYFFSLLNGKQEESTSRGFGLYINKNVLTKSGGDVELVDTSEKGTVFKLTIPVKLRKD